MDPFERIAGLLQEGETFGVATVVVSADPGVPLGARALILSDGTVEGTLGRADLDKRAAELGAEALERRKRRTEEVAGVKVFVDVLSPGARLLVCGAGHIAVALARFARDVGFAVTVLDDRPDFAHPSRFPGCEVIAEDFVPALRSMPLGPASYVVVITRGHEHDTECLVEVLRRETAYVGLIGSRRRVTFVRDLLGREGVPTERLQSLFTPIGLPLGAESPEEIALSIASELVSVRRRGAEAARQLRGEAGGSP